MFRICRLHVFLKGFIEFLFNVPEEVEGRRRLCEYVEFVEGERAATQVMELHFSTACFLQHSFKLEGATTNYNHAGDCDAVVNPRMDKPNKALVRGEADMTELIAQDNTFEWMDSRQGGVLPFMRDVERSNHPNPCEA